MTGRLVRVAVASLCLTSLSSAGASAQAGRPARVPGWEQLSPLPFPLWGPAGASVDRCTLLSIGGQDSDSVVRDETLVLDPQLNMWTAKASMPEGRYGVTAAVVGQNVYVVGGYTAGDPAIARGNFVYDAASDTWTIRRPLPSPAGIATAAEASAGGRVYVVGGDDGDSISNDTNYEYNATTDSWRARAPMPTPRENDVAVGLRGRIYVAGGMAVQVSLDGLRTFESYDPRTDTWTRLKPMIFPRVSPGIATDGRYVYVWGGAASYEFSSLWRNAERYDPVTDTWSQIEQLGLAVDAPASGFADGMLISAGGDYEDVTQSLTVRPSSC
jgi:N-acetylneuraminic acid mutarotase